MSRRPDDDALFDRLAAALAEPPAEPSAVEVAEVRHALLAPGPMDTVHALPRPNRQRVLVGAVAAALLIVIGASIVVAQRPAHDVVQAQGAPGESVALTRARTSLRELKTALAKADRAAVASALEKATARVRDLSRADRAKVDTEADDLFARAAQLLARTPPPPTTAPVVPTTVDDHGGNRGRSGGGSGPG